MEATLGRWSGLEELREGLGGLLRRHCRDESEVEDVIQETFVRAARYRENLADSQRLYSWTSRIAMNVLADTKRRGRRVVFTAPGEGLLEELPAAAAPAEEECWVEEFQLGPWVIGRESALRHLAAALGTLRQEDQRLLSAFYGSGESCLAAAEACSLPRAVVKIRLFRARTRLVKALRRRLSMSQGGAAWVA